MKGYRTKVVRGLAVGLLALTLLVGGCAQQKPPAEPVTGQSIPAETADLEGEAELRRSHFPGVAGQRGFQ